jgi:hypothetical protein
VNLAVFRELYRVIDQVVYDLQHLHPVDHRPGIPEPVVEMDRRVFVGCEQYKIVDARIHKFRDVRLFHGKLYHAGFYLGDVEELVDKGIEVVGDFANDEQVTALGVR